MASRDDGFHSDAVNISGGDPRPVIIIAAARSGTKLLRRIIASADEFGGCPYDANYVWKLGNLEILHDELTISDLDVSNIKAIRKFFDRARSRDGAARLLEKTVSNSLRLEMVKKVFPNAQIIHLHRNGRAAAASARKSWTLPPNSNDLQSSSERYRKLREFPVLSAWPYLVQYLKTYGMKTLLASEYVDSWGPRYKGIDKDVERISLEHVVAKQWSICVERSVAALMSLKVDTDYLNVAYEDLLLDTEGQLRRISSFIEARDSEKIISTGLALVDTSRANEKNSTEDIWDVPEIAQILQQGDAALKRLSVNGTSETLIENSR